MFFPSRNKKRWYYQILNVLALFWNQLFSINSSDQSFVWTAIQERYLRVSSLRQRFATIRLLQNQLEQTHEVQISTQTMRNRLREYDLRPRVAARGPALTPARVDFAREHIHWEEADWERVLFTDESRFCLYHRHRRSLVYRRPRERYAQCNFLNRPLPNVYALS